MIALKPAHKRLVVRLLKKHVPGHRVLAFGSRVTGKAKTYSDLDLVVMGKKPLSLSALGALREDLMESDLPFRVDLVDWAAASEEFRRIIKRDAVRLI